MPRILRIINRFNLGGPTYNAAYLTRYLDGKTPGCDLNFETMLIGGSPIRGEAHSGFILDNLGVRYTEIPEMSRSINPLNDLRTFIKIRRIIREYKPDIVHTHAAKAGAIGRLAARLENVPVIVHTYHGHVFSNYFGPIKSWLVKTAERWLAGMSTAIVNISEALSNEIVHQHHICPESKAFVIPLGFDLARFQINMTEKRTRFRETYKLSEKDIAIGIIGRFAPVKNHPLFIDTLSILHENKVPFRAFVIGDGDQKNTLINYALEKKLSAGEASDAQVVFTSWIKNIDEALAGLDIVVLTSLNEGTPVSLIEAQAAGKAIVSTDVGGVHDCVVPDETGVLCAQHPNEIATAITQFIQSEELRKSFGEKGVTFVNQRYSYERLVSDMTHLYIQLLGKI